MFKRAWLSIKRKKNRTIILSIVLFIIANLILATIAIKNTTEEQVNYAKASLGGEVSLQANMEALRNNKEDSNTKIERPSIYINDVTKIATSNYVKDYTYSISTGANVVDIEVEENNISNNSNMPGKNMPEMMKSIGNVTIEGINSYAYISGVKNNTITLEEGTYFDENTDNKIIISVDLAELNDLKVGDTIKLENTSTEEEISLEIIGIYDQTTEDDTRSFINSSNKMYMNVKTASLFLSEDDYNEGNYAVNNVTYYLNDSEEKDLFIKEANTLVTTLKENNLTLSSDTRQFDNMSGAIESVGSFASVILIVVLVASIIIISLIVNSSIKERKYEMGVLLSLGETKKHMTGQLIIELILIATFAFILSIGTSSYVAKKMSTALLENQITLSEKQSENNFGRPGIMDKVISREKTTLEVNASLENYITLFIVGYVIIIISMILPTINIIKYEPKEVLTRRNI